MNNMYMQQQSVSKFYQSLHVYSNVWSLNILRRIYTYYVLKSLNNYGSLIVFLKFYVQERCDNVNITQE